MPKQRRRYRWLGQALVSCVSTTAASNAAAMCSERSTILQAAYVSSQSDWQEFDAAGKRIVHESGSLGGTELSAGITCGRWNFQALLTELRGDRAYEGQTSTATPVTTQSAIRQTRGQVQAGLHLGEPWLLGVRWTGQTGWRDIASAGNATGYPERFDWTLLSLGTQWKRAIGTGQLTLSAWAGRQLTSSMELNLPGRDQAMLALGPIRQRELSIAWLQPLDHGWSLQVDASHRRTDIGVGDSALIRRNGLPVGVAYQPQSRAVDTPLAIRIAYSF